MSRYSHWRAIDCKCFRSECAEFCFTMCLAEQTLLQMGAILSRALAQRYIAKHVTVQSNIVERRRWPILREAYRLYGDLSRTSYNDMKDEKVISQWNEREVRLRGRYLDEATKEIFEVGKFATFFSNENKARREMALIIAHHPHLLEVIERNGFDMEQADMDAM